MINVYSITDDGEVIKQTFSCDPLQALVNAFEQNKGNNNWWNYKKISEYDFQTKKHGIMLGKFWVRKKEFSWLNKILVVKCKNHVGETYFVNFKYKPREDDYLKATEYKKESQNVLGVYECPELDGISICTSCSLARKLGLMRKIV